MFKNWKNIKKHSKNTVQTAQNQYKVLIAPLDWGLGHITRCIPLIRYLLQKNCQISIATNAAGRALLLSEFPELQYLQVEGYNISYPVRREDFIKKIFLQIPVILRAIRSEKAWLREHQRVHQWDLIISDNRFGFYLPGVPSVFITHQLAIRSGMHPWLDRVIKRLNYSMIRKFSQCWVPDMEGKPNLAGELSHPEVLPEHTVYIGPLSRMQIQSGAESDEILILLSGPEPQRTLLENKLLTELKDYRDRVLFIRGLPGEISLPVPFNRVEFRNHLPANELQLALLKAKLIICRSGYSTIMDLTTLKKKAILIPTPGQTEQEYLAGYLLKEKMFYSVNQDQFSLSVAISESDRFPYQIPDFPKDFFKKSIDQFVNSI